MQSKAFHYFAVLGRCQKQQTSLPTTEVIGDVYGILARIVFTKSAWKFDLIRVNGAISKEQRAA